MQGNTAWQEIMVVDDDPQITTAIASLLKSNIPEVNIRTAADPETALQKLAENPRLDILITDYKMPGKTGLELIQEVQETNPLVDSVLITAYPEIDLLVEAINKWQIKYFFLKPIQPQQLEKTIRTLMTNRAKKLQKDWQFYEMLRKTQINPA